MTYHPLPLPRLYTFACSPLKLYSTVFRRLCLEYYLKTAQCGSETKPTISEQSDCASSFESSCESLDWSFESFVASLSSISPGWVMTSTNKIYNVSYQSLFPSSISSGVIFSSCVVFVMWSIRGVILRYAVICRICMFAEVHLVLPCGWKCLYIWT